MTKRQREMLAKLCEVCNQLGVELDGTATNTRKYIDRQMALMNVHTVLYGVLCDEAENDFREVDVERGNKALLELSELIKKTYPDKNGYLKEEEKNFLK